MKQMTTKWKCIVGCTTGVILLGAILIGYTCKNSSKHEVQTIQIWFQEDTPQEECIAIIEEYDGKIISEENTIGMYMVQVNSKSPSEAERICRQMETHQDIESAIYLDTSVEPEVQGFRGGEF